MDIWGEKSIIPLSSKNKITVFLLKSDDENGYQCHDSYQWTTPVRKYERYTT